MSKYRHYKHKTDWNRYLYRDEGRPIYGLPEGYTSGADWDVTEELRSLSQIPLAYRRQVEANGFVIYWLPDDAT
jgi:hypothetical protein